jgi:hypothetical protein
LNHDVLKQNRQSALFSLRKKLGEIKPAEDWQTLAIKYRNQLEAETQKQEYIGILLWYLDDKIR